MTKLLGALLLIGCNLTPPARPVQPTTALRDPDERLLMTAEVDSFCLTADPFVDPTAGYAMFQGSAVVLDGRHLLTARHVVDCPYLPDYHVELFDGRRFEVTVTTSDVAGDWALLTVVGSSLAWAPHPPVMARAAVGDEVCSYHRVPEPPGSDCGLVTELRPDGFVVMTTHVEHGNSGGPVYNKAGALVGLVHALYQDADGNFISGVYTTLPNRAVQYGP